MSLAGNAARGSIQISLDHAAAARQALRAVFVFTCLAAILYALLPSASTIAWAQQLAPDHALEDKTIALIYTLRWCLPIAGAAGLLWIVIAPHLQHPLRDLLAVIAASQWSLPVILLIAALVRVAWLLYFPTHPYADSLGYMAAATQLAGGHGFVWDLESNQPLVGWPVGYPSFLAALFVVTGPNANVALGLNVLVAVLTVAQTAWLGALLFGRAVGLLAALLLALFPGMIVYTSLVSTELLFLWLTTLCFWLAVRPQSPARTATKTLAAGLATGMAAGGAALVRATGLMLLPFWAVLHWATQRKPRQAALWGAALLVGSLLVVLPWTARNYVRFHKFIPVSTNGGMNFWIGNNPNAYGGFMFPHDPAINPLYLINEARDEVRLEAEGYRLGREWLRTALRSDPRHVYLLYRAKVVYMLTTFDFGLHWNALSAAQKGQPGTGVIAFVVVNATYWAALAGAAFGMLALCLARTRGTVRQWSPLLLFVYWLLLHLPYFGQDRFMLPMLPGLLIYCALGIAIIGKITLAGPFRTLHIESETR